MRRTWGSDDETGLMGLTFVPTPLGNLRDITLRALDTLREADLIVAEDTRVTRKLLTAHGIGGKLLWSHHEHNAAGTIASIVERARTERVAVVSDAGMPGISDPGVPLLAAAREAGVTVEVLPGPTAFACAAVLSGLDVRRFTFEGFPSRASSARKAAFAQAIARGMPSVWYESPHRILASLADLAEIAPDVRVFVLREFTKLHEQQTGGTANYVAATLEQPVRGEIVLVVDAGAAPASVVPSEADLDAQIDTLLAAGASTAHIAKTLANAGAGKRSDLYARAVARSEGRKTQDEGSP
jgi:16S rRNA (cytidine1402-2'-O)-methyltransferase